MRQLAKAPGPAEGLHLLRWRLLQFGVQMNRAASDIEGLRPVGEALFLDGDLMDAGRDRDR